MNAAHLIGARDGRKYLVDANGNTHDIIRAIMQADSVCQPYTAALAPTLRGRTDMETCHNLWQFWKQHVKYQEDPDNFQFVKSPRELYHSGEGDCKSYSIALASCLKNLGIPHCYRFVTEERGKEYHHVYIVAKPHQGSEIIIDCVLDKFNYQNPFVKKLDKAGSPPPVPQHRGIGRLNITPDGKLQVNAGEKLDLVTPNIFTPGVNETWWAQQLEQQRTELFEPIYNYGDLLNMGKRPRYYHMIKGMIYKDVKESNGSLKASILFGTITDPKRLDAFLTLAYCMVYSFWDDASMGTFPLNLSAKKQAGINLKNELTGLGLRSGTLRAMCDYSIWNLYGISLDYLLYRCSNYVKYGTYWKPVNGVPYYDTKTGTLKANNAALEQTVRLASCFPYNGGCQRPIGTPYWTVGGFVMRNKATDSMFTGWLSKNPKPANIQNYTPASAVTANTEIYQRWLNGNIPGLPVILPPNKVQIAGRKHAVGYGVAEIVSIVVAVVSAVATITGIVIAIVNQVKAGNTSNIPDVARDFAMEFQTTDGCYIGTQNGTGAKLKCCPDGTCVPYNPNDPTHQPAAGNFANAAGGNMLLLGGGALLVGYALLTGNSKD